MKAYATDFRLVRPGFHSKGRTLLATLCIASANPAWAQGGAEGVATVEEIVVTAQRREESIQRTSLSIQVLASEALAAGGVVSPKDLTGVVPGVQVAQGGGYTQIYVRGIGDYAGNLLAQPSVAFNVDDVVVGSNAGLGTQFYDLERVEILKGPQGTLYGRNSAGGAVNVISRKPTREFGGDFRANVGNYALRHVSGALNVPASEAWSFRGAFQATRRDGYLSDGTDDERSASMRLHGLWSPSAKVSLLLTVSGGEQDGQGPGASIRPKVDDDPWLGPSDPRVNAFRSINPAFGFLPQPELKDDTYLRNELRNASVQLTADLGFAELTVIPAYRYSHMRTKNNAFGFVNIDDSESRQSTLEARLSHDSARLKWVAGVYAYDQKQTSSGVIDQGALMLNHFSVGSLKTESQSFFGQATLGVSDRLRVIGGIRYTAEDRELRDGSFIITSAVLPSGTVPLGGAREDSAVTWKTGLEYDLFEHSMAYATVSTGFKGGGINLMSPGPGLTYAPEKVAAYAVGARNRFVDGRLVLNLEAFYWDYQDKQENRIGFDSAGLFLPIYENAGQAEIYGASVELVTRMGAGGTLAAALEYVKSEYEEFSYPSAFGLPPDPSRTGCRAGAPGFVDCSGFALARAPEWSGSVSYEHSFGLTNNAEIKPRLEVVFASERWLNTDFLAPNGRADGYALTNAELAYIAPGSRWSVAAWIRNIGNTAVYNAAFQTAANGIFFANIGAPRTFGVRMGIEF